MSTWTHVNGSVRIDNIRGFMPEIDFGKMFKTCSYADKKSKWDECNVPKGSEGSLQIEVTTNPNKSCTAVYVVNIYGDLRDYESVNEVKEWFIKSFAKSNLMIRQGFISIECENGRSCYLKISGFGEDCEVTELLTKTKGE